MNGKEKMEREIDIHNSRSSHKTNARSAAFSRLLPETHPVRDGSKRELCVEGRNRIHEI